MLSETEARGRVWKWLSERRPAGKEDVVIVDKYTETYDGCYVFYWVLKKYWLTKNPAYQAGGNYQILVDASDGTLYGTGRMDASYYVDLLHRDKYQLQDHVLS
jgi:hypothetical protein